MNSSEVDAAVQAGLARAAAELAEIAKMLARVETLLALAVSAVETK